MKKTILAGALVGLATVGLLLVQVECAHAAEPVARFAAGANGVWFGGTSDLPADLELGGSARASFSPHISAVGGAWYGTEKNYLRATLGARFTVTDVSDPNFSIGVGSSYVASSKPEVRPEEFQGEVALGWRPYPASMPNVVLVGLGAYGFDSNSGSALIGIRYSLGYEERGEQP